MAEKHPYTSGPGAVTQAVSHLRSSFPPKVTADTLKKLGIAKNNESYLINILRFLKVIDPEGKQTAEAGTIFHTHDQKEFEKAFAALIEAAYKDLFQLHGSNAWTLPADKLIAFFRGTDHTSLIVGQRQAQTFQILSKLSGHGDAVPAASGAKTAPAAPKKAATAKPAAPSKVTPTAAVNLNSAGAGDGSGSEVGLTVRVEINLPVADDRSRDCTGGPATPVRPQKHPSRLAAQDSKALR